ncbi:NAD(P)/FAD-dependent oxidoreductase, partial [Streptomyces sp. DSM 41529]|nr:NAD(P)/FAD-dependent oxidoreductase [Streptomyces sp. DSM 41529]
LMHRTYHLSRVPTFNRKARVLAEWTLAGLFKREIVSLGSLEHPRAEFELAAGGGASPAPRPGTLPRPDPDERPDDPPEAPPEGLPPQASR